MQQKYMFTTFKNSNEKEEYIKQVIQIDYTFKIMP